MRGVVAEARRRYADGLPLRTLSTPAPAIAAASTGLCCGRPAQRWRHRDGPPESGLGPAPVGGHVARCAAAHAPAVAIAAAAAADDK